MDRIEYHHIKQNKLDWERQISHALSHIQNLEQQTQNDMNCKMGLFEMGN
jgi:hypothetical protein